MATTKTSIFSHKTFCVITGASKGLGRCMAERFSAKMASGSVLVLMARSEKELERTAELVRSTRAGIRVKVCPVDLSTVNAQNIENTLTGIYSEYGVKVTDFEQALIVHNAASLGDVSKRMSEQDDVTSLKTYFDLNLTSVLVLNSVFLRHFNEKSVTHRTVVQTSSVCALQPFKTWSLYCAGKAARDMLFRTMALEEDSIRVLNYAPGPVDTDMQVTARTQTGDKGLKEMFSDMHTESKLLTCDQSVDKLVKLLETNTFSSGAHIDYYDM